MHINGNLKTSHSTADAWVWFHNLVTYMVLLYHGLGEKSNISPGHMVLGSALGALVSGLEKGNLDHPVADCPTKDCSVKQHKLYTATVSLT